jgi:hypothetical protein
MSDGKHKVQVFGAFFFGYAQACKNLGIVAGRTAAQLTDGLEPTNWYPIERLRQLEALVVRHYRNPDPIMARVGEEIMRGWYHFGPGKQLVSSAPGFLEFQSGANGYRSVVKGPEALVGSFSLVELDATRGLARVHSTTPLNRAMERGVLIGGMTAPGGVDYIDVFNPPGDDDSFIVEWH